MHTNRFFVFTIYPGQTDRDRDRGESVIKEYLISSPLKFFTLQTHKLFNPVQAMYISFFFFSTSHFVNFKMVRLVFFFCQLSLHVFCWVGRVFRRIPYDQDICVCNNRVKRKYYLFYSYLHIDQKCRFSSLTTLRLQHKRLCVMLLVTSAIYKRICY